MDLDRLRYFQAVAYAGSYSAAARLLHVSQPALSRSIQSLENAYEVQLFERGHNGAQVTVAGSQLLGVVEDLLERADRLDRAFTDMGRGEVGVVRFGVGSQAVSMLLPQLLTGLEPELKDITVEIYSDRVHNLRAALTAGDIEFFLGREELSAPPDPAIEVEFLRVGSPVLLVRKGHPLARAGSFRAEDLENVVLASSDTWNQSLLSFRDESLRRMYSSHLVLDNFNILAQVAEHSDIAIVTAFRSPFESLVTIPFPAEHAAVLESKVALFTSLGSPLSPLAQRMADTLRRAFIQW